MQMLSALIEQLASMDHREFDLLCEKTLPIIAHNRAWFFSQQFQERLCQELFDNFDTAITTQQQQSIEFPAGTWLHTMNTLCKPISWPSSWKAHAREILKNLQETHPGRVGKALEVYPGLQQAL
jgi:hypothetical protein